MWKKQGNEFSWSLMDPFEFSILLFTDFYSTSWENIYMGPTHLHSEENVAITS